MFRIFATSGKQASCKEEKQRSVFLNSGPGLGEFLPGVKVQPPLSEYMDPSLLRGDGAKVYLDVYGFQMNYSNMEVVTSQPHLSWVLCDTGGW